MQTRSWEEPRGAERRNCGGKTPVYHEEEDEREDRSERTCRIGHGRHARNWARHCGSVFGCGCFGLGVRSQRARGFADARRRSEERRGGKEWRRGWEGRREWEER